MRLWRLSPIQTDSPQMEGSWYEGEVTVRALDEESARNIADKRLGIAVETRKGADTVHSPWKQPEIVSCIECNDTGFSKVGKAAVLSPVVDPIS